MRHGVMFVKERNAKVSPMRRHYAALCAALLVSVTWMVSSGATGQTPAAIQPPAVGEAARDFTLNRIDGKPIALSALTTQGPVVVLMLRGWVGYQ